MQRDLMQELKRWKNKPEKKPLIIKGARQVGKTWLLKEFGKTEYDDVVYINFDNNEQMKQLFAGSLEIDRLITGMELFSGKKIRAEHTLLIFDEVQEVPRALTSLKYFNENAPEYQIVCAGSLLGIALHPGTSFPVGKVEFLELYPLSFFEFLTALGKGQFADCLRNGDFETAAVFRETYTDLLKQYYYIGGMPEAVDAFVKHRDFQEVREIQERILFSYEQDFSKHAPDALVPRIRMLWQSVPGQLAKENKKFIYGLIREGARAKEYETALLWLTDCGLVHKVGRIKTAALPLKMYEDLRAFKLFLNDVGLLSCLAGLDRMVLLNGNDLFKEFKGALTEQYVFQQLKTVKNLQIFYWTPDRGTAEVDFVLSSGSSVVPLEVKAEVNLQAKSLKIFYEKYHPEVSVRTAMTAYKKEGWLVNLPLWGIGAIDTLL